MNRRLGRGQPRPSISYSAFCSRVPHCATRCGAGYVATRARRAMGHSTIRLLPLHIVIRFSKPDLLKNPHFPVHSSAQGPPRGLCLTVQLSRHQSLQRPVLETRNRRVRRCVGLLERLLERLCVQLRILRQIRPAKQLATQVPKRVPTPVATQFSIRSDEHRDVLRETQGTFRRAFRRTF
jgi:hypothetical protein